MISIGEVQGLVSAWWFDYDQADFDAWPSYFTTDAHFSCRSDSGPLPSRNSSPLTFVGATRWWRGICSIKTKARIRCEHNGTNVHVVFSDQHQCTFR